MAEPPDKRSDAELFDAARKGDSDAFAVLYRRYRDWVVRLAYRYCGHQDDALEALQETFAYCLRKLPDLRLTVRMTTFLFPVVKHTALAAMRRRRRFVSGESLPEASVMPQLPESEENETLAAMLAGLSVAQRETLILRFVDEMSISEIAEAMGVPEGTVKSRLHEGLKRVSVDRLE
jgi:RNA polymerase sigma-70 factor (ECF subfamily)